MKKAQLIYVLAGVLSAAGLVACSSDDNNVPDTTEHHAINFSGISNVSFVLDTYSVESGGVWKGLSNNQACVVSKDYTKESAADTVDTTNGNSTCSALVVVADSSPSYDVAGYLSSHGVQLTDNATGGMANIAFGGTLKFMQNGIPASCSGIYFSQITNDGERLWTMYDSYNNSITPSYDDQDSITLQCQNGGSIVLSGDDLPDTLDDDNSFMIRAYTSAPQ